MPSKPKTRALEKQLAKWHGPSWRDVLLGRLEDGSFISELAREIEARAKVEGLTNKIAVSRSVLSRLLRSTPGGEAAVRASRAEGAHAVAERVVEVARTAKADKDEVQRARLEVDALKWMASHMSEEYSDKPAGPAVVVDMGRLFIQAAARPGALPPPPQKALPPADAEVIEGDEPESPAVTAAYAKSDAERARQKRVSAVMREYGCDLKTAQRRVMELEHGERPPALNDQMPPGSVRPVVRPKDDEEDDDG